MVTARATTLIHTTDLQKPVGDSCPLFIQSVVLPYFSVIVQTFTFQFGVLLLK